MADRALINCQDSAPPFPQMSLRQAAQELGLSYSSVRRIFSHEPEVLRFSNTLSGHTVYPGAPRKRFQRIRMTYVIPRHVFERVRRRLGGVMSLTC
jgi:hypothetical protein